MASPSTTLDPIRNAVIWSAFTLVGLVSPGSIPKGGMKGFRRKTGWDEKSGKGTQGATLTLVAAPPCKGSIKLQLFTPGDFVAWDSFVRDALSINPTQQKAAGLAIYHPSLSSIGLTTVVVDNYSAPEHVGKGLYEVEIHLIEWQQPPAKSIVSTPDSTAEDESGDAAKNSPLTVAQSLAKANLLVQIALATAAAKAP